MVQDSLVFNQSSIDRGMFRATVMKTTREEARPANRERFGLRPEDKLVGKHQGGYEKVDVDGLAAPGVPVEEGEATILKTAPAGGGSGSRGSKRRDMSSVVKKGDGGTVDAVCSTVDETDTQLVKLRTRSTRVLTVGDKLASRHGQKVSTICVFVLIRQVAVIHSLLSPFASRTQCDILNAKRKAFYARCVLTQSAWQGVCSRTATAEDMPWTAEGIVPDMLINPHCIPSRMTVGHLMEALLSKAGALSGEFGDGTAFRTGNPRKEAEDALHRLGYQRHGEEVLYNPHTGKQMEGTVFMAPTFYQRLKHMVNDKARLFRAFVFELYELHDPV